MHVVVCAKQIPDPADPGRLDPETRTLVREGKLVLDEADSYGVEVGLRLVEQAGSGEVALVSMAPAGQTGGLRTALAMGAARAVLVSDAALLGSDALVTAKVLAAAVRRVVRSGPAPGGDGPGVPDLVVAATESTDGYTGTMPVQLAELLGLPAVTYAKRVEAVGGRLRVERQTEAGYDEVECPLPALVTVTAGVVEPRYPSFKGIMSARTKPVEEVRVGDLGLDEAEVGLAGARQTVLAVAPAEQRKGGQVVRDEGDGAERIVALLEQLKVV